MSKFNTIEAAFNNEGKVIGKAAALIQAAREATNREIQKAVDELTIAWGTSGTTKAKYWGKPSGEIRKAIKATMALGVAAGAFQEDMAETLVHCVGVAFIADVPFTRTLKQSHKADGTPREAKAEGDTEGESAGTSGAVKSTTPEACEKTARKLIEQLRILGKAGDTRADTIAAGIVDVMREFNPEFSETEAKK